MWEIKSIDTVVVFLADGRYIYVYWWLVLSGSFYVGGYDVIRETSKLIVLGAQKGLLVAVV